MVSGTHPPVQPVPQRTIQALSQKTVPKDCKSIATRLKNPSWHTSTAGAPMLAPPARGRDTSRGSPTSSSAPASPARGFDSPRWQLLFGKARVGSRDPSLTEPAVGPHSLSSGAYANQTITTDIWQGAHLLSVVWQQPRAAGAGRPDCCAAPPLRSDLYIRV